MTSGTRYELIEPIGRGGYGDVFRGRAAGAHGFAKPVAIKRLPTHLADDPTFVDALIREAKILATLDHANIVSVVDLVRTPDDLFLVLDLVDGTSLRELLDARRPPVGVAVFCVECAARGVAYAHGRRGGSVIHLDLSPENILLSRNGDVRVTDFGIARVEGISERTGQIEGKWHYMPPEQARGERLTTKSDIYGLGAVLYESLAGVRPFSDKRSATGVRVALTRGEAPTPLETHCPDLPASLIALCASMLDAEPRRRPESMQAVAEGLRALRFGEGWADGAPELARLMETVAPKRADPQQMKVRAVLDELGLAGDDDGLRTGRLEGTLELGDTKVGATAKTPGTRETGDPLIGATVDDRYTILEKIGIGGMGSVYRARQTSVDREIAVKVMRTDRELGALAVQRFETEAKIVSKLRHPSALRLIDFGRDAAGLLFMVSDLLEGESLRARLVRGPLDVQATLQMLAEVADALDEAHGLGVIHRDLKPANIFLERIQDRTVVRVLDFGIARLAQAPSGTSTGRVVGTPHYLSPEQAQDSPVDGRSDLYSLGVVAFECLAGRRPFEAETSVSLLMKHVSTPPPSLRELAPAVPEPVADLVARLLAKRPEDRPSDAAALRDELVRLTSAPQAELRPASDPEQPAVLPPAPATVPQPPTSRRSAAVFVGVFGALATLAAVWASMGPQERAAAPPVVAGQRADTATATAEGDEAGPTPFAGVAETSAGDGGGEGTIAGSPPAVTGGESAAKAEARTTGRAESERRVVDAGARPRSASKRRRPPREPRPSERAETPEAAPRPEATKPPAEVPEGFIRVLSED